MKLFKNRTALGVICIILAVSIIFLITPMFNKIFEGKKNIVRLVTDIKQGQIISEKDISLVEVGSYNLPSNIINNPKQVIGKYAVADMFKNDYIMSSKIADKITTIESQLINLKNGEMAVSLSLESLAVSVSGKLKQGDIIQILTERNDEMVVPDELKYVEVLLVTDSTGTEFENNSNPKDNISSSAKDEIPKTIILKTQNSLQAKRIAECEQSKTHLALITRDETEKSKYLDEQKKILDNLELNASEQSFSTPNNIDNTEAKNNAE